MISPAEEEYVRDQAYLPEQILGYGMAVSGGEPFLLGDYLAYVPSRALIFIGYPLKGNFDEEEMERVLEGAIKRFHPDRVALIAPAISRRSGERHPSDAYYRLNLKNLRVHSKVKNMIHRASRELTVEISREFTPEHSHLIAGFKEGHPLNGGTERILDKISKYLATSSSALIFNARDSSGRLAAFDIGDFWPHHCVIYMFNFRRLQDPVPGTSDLLLSAILNRAQQEGKEYANLGLGLNEGVAFFKKKWGAEVFLPHEACSFSTSTMGFWRSLFFR